MGGARTGLLVVTLGALFSTGCFSPSPEAVARLEQTKKDTAELDGALASLEDRFLGNQYQVQLWSELARRHEQVSAVVCKNHSAHFAEMAMMIEKQTEKARSLKRRRGNVADAKVVMNRRGMGGPAD